MLQLGHSLQLPHLSQGPMLLPPYMFVQVLQVILRNKEVLGQAVRDSIVEQVL